MDIIVEIDKKEPNDNGKSRATKVLWYEKGCAAVLLLKPQPTLCNKQGS